MRSADIKTLNISKKKSVQPTEFKLIGRSYIIKDKNDVGFHVDC